MRLILIRHFQTPGNLEKRYIGQTDEPLLESEELLENIAKKRDYLAEIGKVEYVAASPMKRCIQSASYLFPDQIPILKEQMRECDFGTFEGKNYEELKETADYQEWMESYGTLPFPKGESQEIFQARCVECFETMVEELIHQRCNLAAMVVHGGTIMSVLSYFDKKGRGFYDWQVENGGGYLVSLDEKAWKQGNKEFREIRDL